MPARFTPPSKAAMPEWLREQIGTLEFGTKRNKYGNRKQVEPCHLCGYRHDSAKEARACGQLAMLEKAGEIAWLERQVPIMLSADGQPVMVGKRQARFTADFRYQRDGRVIIHEIKAQERRARSRDYALRFALAKINNPEWEFIET